ncbi:GerMN domain-containing protein [Caldalkalibacillus thermarum]|uniref:GerMN domain-containing protein n=1 Tax=Caldalkalibacillus thermarum TaxID=296745 RepID=UPI00166B4A9B|nr:GerMN domain-containing protein [Caldalkalibacillus thermarum]
MNKENRWQLLLLMGCLVVLILSACGQQTIDTQTGAGDEQEQSQEAEEPVVSEPNEEANEEANKEEGESENNADEQQGETVKITFYYADHDLLEVVEEQHEVVFETDEDKLRAVWNHLQNPQTETANPLWKNFDLNDIRLEGTTVIIDVSMHDGAYFGASAEGMAIQTLLDTFAQLNGVEYIHLLVDGKVSETLAGHVSIEEPIPVDTGIYSDQ